jgi:hypothetical protein
MFNFENIWPQPQQIKASDEFQSPNMITVQGIGCSERRLRDIMDIDHLIISDDKHAYPLTLDINPNNLLPEGYHLTLSPTGATIVGADEIGLDYGVETLLQIVALTRSVHKWPNVEITDWPTYKKRCFMADMGRSVFSKPLLKRLIRILSRLKMNQLHLHLYDDELCGLRFDSLPFGSENPFAISISDLKEVVEYAAEYYIEVIPELESWGHVTSIVYHRPELRGGEGMYHGSSFLICEKTFELMKQLIDQVLMIMPKKCTIHLGMDEANWFTGHDLPESFTPTHMLGRYYNILQELAARQGKSATLRIWADHAGRPVPNDIQHNVIIEPWDYWNKNKDDIIKKIERFSGERKMRWMIGAGQSGAQHRGAIHATRLWCRLAKQSPNVDGVNITFWMRNDLERNFITLFGGAFYAWNPSAQTSFSDIEDYEYFDQMFTPVMLRWQSLFPDANPDLIVHDRGPNVYNGFYLWGKHHGQPVAPTAPVANTLYGHDYLNEHVTVEN